MTTRRDGRGGSAAMGFGEGRDVGITKSHTLWPKWSFVIIKIIKSSPRPPLSTHIVEKNRERICAIPGIRL